MARAGIQLIIYGQRNRDDVAGVLRSLEMRRNPGALEMGAEHASAGRALSLLLLHISLDGRQSGAGQRSLGEESDTG